jgi:subtilisin-like proprotein convertase family protein
MAVLGTIVLFLSGCGGLLDAINDALKNGVFLSDTEYVLNDNHHISSSIDVDTNIVSLTTVNVIVSIEHDHDSDLVFYLKSPDATVITLSTNNGTNDNLGYAITFKDDANASITNGIKPHITAYIPEDPLSTFNNKNPDGIWTLYVYDTVNNAQVGKLKGWSLWIQGNQ